jgi:hypothetical protein
MRNAIVFVFYRPWLACQLGAIRYRRSLAPDGQHRRAVSG